MTAVWVAGASQFAKRYALPIVNDGAAKDPGLVDKHPGLQELLKELNNVSAAPAPNSSCVSEASALRPTCRQPASQVAPASSGQHARCSTSLRAEETVTSPQRSGVPVHLDLDSPGWGPSETRVPLQLPRGPSAGAPCPLSGTRCSMPALRDPVQLLHAAQQQDTEQALAALADDRSTAAQDKANKEAAKRYMRQKRALTSLVLALDPEEDEEEIAVHRAKIARIENELLKVQVCSIASVRTKH
jgi:hypothetical protein